MWLCNVVVMFSYANILFAKLLMVTGLVEKLGYPMWGPTWGRLWGTAKNLQTRKKTFLVLRCREYLTHRKKCFL